MGHEQSQQKDQSAPTFDPYSMTFGTVFGCSMVNKPLKPYTIPLDDKKMRVLFLSDTHIGANLPAEQSIELFINEVSQLIKGEQITMICHLGDLINWNIPNGQTLLNEVLVKLGEFKLPVYYIGGNHDRNFMELLNWKQNEYVHPLFHINSMKFEIPSLQEGQNPIKFFFGHDLENNFRVTDKYAVLFVNWLKDGFKKDIQPEDWLINGHTHVSALCPPLRVGCVGQFSPEINEFAYAILEIDQGNAYFCNKINASKIVNPNFKFGMNKRMII